MTSVLITRSACPVCASQNYNSLYRKPYSDLQEWIEKAYAERGKPRPEVLADETYELRQCNDCSMIFQAGVPSDDLAGEIYGQWIDGSIIYPRKFHPLPLRHFDYAIGLVRLLMAETKKSPRDVRFLDFGMGWGDYSMAAMAFGAKVTAVELSEEKRNHGAERGIQVVSEPVGLYDVILLNQVLEHLPDPVAILSQLRGHLDKGGIIYAATPNGAPVYKCAHSFGEQDFLAHQKTIAPLEHLNIFNFETLAQAGKSAGLRADHPQAESLSRMTAAAFKGHIMRRIGLTRTMAAQAVYRVEE